MTLSLCAAFQTAFSVSSKPGTTLVWRTIVIVEPGEALVNYVPSETVAPCRRQIVHGADLVPIHPWLYRQFAGRDAAQANAQGCSPAQIQADTHVARR